MLLGMGKIKTIGKDDPLLKPSLDYPLSFYTGYYYLKEEANLDASATGNSFLYKINPGFLEIYISYSSDYKPGENTSYYINYRLTTQDGSLYIWRYYAHKEEGVLTFLDRTDRPKLLLTKNKIGKLVYTKDEMDELFLNKKASHLDNDEYFIRTPKIEVVPINKALNKLDFRPTNMFNTEDIMTEEEFDRSKIVIDGFKDWEKFNNLLVWRFKDSDSRLEYFLENETSVNNSLALDPYRSNVGWLTKELNKEDLAISPGRNDNIFNQQGLYKRVNRMLATLGDWSANLFRNWQVPKMAGDTMQNYNLEQSIGVNQTCISRVVGNTYFPDIAPIISGELHQVKWIPNNGIQMDKFREQWSDSLLEGYTRSSFHMGRIMNLPDNDMVSSPVILYGNNGTSGTIEGMKYRGADTGYAVSEDFLNNFTKSNMWPIIQSGVEIKYALARQLRPGNILTTHLKKEHFVKRVNLSTRSKTLGIQAQENKFYDLYSTPQYGQWDNPRRKWKNNVLSDHVISNMIDFDYLVTGYRQQSYDVWNTDYIDYAMNLINTDKDGAKLRLGPEVRTTYDLSEYRVDDWQHRVLNIQPDANMALTYFKPEIVKTSPRYTLENQADVYGITFPGEVNFADKLSKSLSLPDSQTLAIDKITVGFRPIQKYVNGRWVPINYSKRRGEGSSTGVENGPRNYGGAT